MACECQGWGTHGGAKRGALAAGTLPLDHPAPPKPRHGCRWCTGIGGGTFIPTCPGQPEQDRCHHYHLHPHPNATSDPPLGYPLVLSILLALPALHPEGGQSPHPQPLHEGVVWPWGAGMSQLGSCSPPAPDPLVPCAWWHMGWGLCPGADARSPARSLGKMLMTLITGLVCAINVYFVVDFLPTLQGLGYHIPLGLLLVVYVAFVAYLVGLALREGVAAWGTVFPVGAHRPALFAPHRSGRAASHTEPGSWPGATTAGSASASPSTRRH